MNNPEINKYGDKFWRNKEGKLHREDGPAVEFAHGSKLWYLNDKCHRDDGPAVERTNGHKEYWINNTKYNSLEEGLMEEALK